MLTEQAHAFVDLTDWCGNHPWRRGKLPQRQRNLGKAEKHKPAEMPLKTPEQCAPGLHYAPEGVAAVERITLRQRGRNRKRPCPGRDHQSIGANLSASARRLAGDRRPSKPELNHLRLGLFRRGRRVDADDAARPTVLGEAGVRGGPLTVEGEAQTLLLLALCAPPDLTSSAIPSVI